MKIEEVQIVKVDVGIKCPYVVCIVMENRGVRFRRKTILRGDCESNKNCTPHIRISQKVCDEVGHTLAAHRIEYGYIHIDQGNEIIKLWVDSHDKREAVLLLEKEYPGFQIWRTRVDDPREEWIKERR